MHRICLYLNIRSDCLIQIAQIHFKYNQLISMNAEKTSIQSQIRNISCILIMNKDSLTHEPRVLHYL